MVTTAKDHRGVPKGLCFYCGKDATSTDHVIPRSWGGTDEPENLVPACKSCNCRKHNLPAEVFTLSGGERSAWLLARGWTRISAKTWLSPDPQEHYIFYSKAAALRRAGFGDRNRE